MNDTTQIVRHSFNLLKNYCEKEGFKGWDPYDGLNSKIFKNSFLNHWEPARLAWIQLFKKNPANLRALVAVPKEYNPKALGLFLTGYCNLYKIGEKHPGQILLFINHLEKLRSDSWSGSCWGYNFDWQARAFYHPKYTPTIVATSFISSALLDAYEITGEARCFEMAKSSCDFILKDLNRHYDEAGNFCFSYSPVDKAQVFNASLLGARLLARIYSITKDKILAEEAGKAVRYCIKQQNQDGSWVYGKLPHHQWIDSFHTGYNLECLSDYINFTGDESIKIQLNAGMKFYLENFFTRDGIPKYYNNSFYPVDIHAPAQLIATLFRLDLLEQNRELAEKVLVWTIHAMQNKKRGYFYYQKTPLFINKIPYMRWAQAWMFYALSFYLLKFHPKNS